ncbi:hypothetical protein B484DRAFT_456626 [Ochromonadaceae sp. CCMP2298]|nr:hypothetical protein B484DRAFT_456626 [Ochromonadaceae sp. CCMP2298]
MRLWALILLASQPRAGQPLLSTRVPERTDIAGAGATPEAALRAQASAAVSSIQHALDELQLHRSRSKGDSSPQRQWGLQESADNVARFQREVESLGQQRLQRPTPSTPPPEVSEQSASALTAPLIRARGRKQVWKTHMRLQRHEDIMRGTLFSPVGGVEGVEGAMGQAEQTQQQMQQQTQQQTQTQKQQTHKEEPREEQSATEDKGEGPDPFTGGRFSLERLVAGELRLRLLEKLRAVRRLAAGRGTGKSDSSSRGSSGLRGSSIEGVREDIHRLLSTLLQSPSGGGGVDGAESPTAWTFRSAEVIDEEVAFAVLDYAAGKSGGACDLRVAALVLPMLLERAASDPSQPREALYSLLERTYALLEVPVVADKRWLFGDKAHLFHAIRATVVSTLEADTGTEAAVLCTAILREGVVSSVRSMQCAAARWEAFSLYLERAQKALEGRGEAGDRGASAQATAAAAAFAIAEKGVVSAPLDRVTGVLDGLFAAQQLRGLEEPPNAQDEYIAQLEQAVALVARGTGGDADALSVVGALVSHGQSSTDDRDRDIFRRADTSDQHKFNSRECIASTPLPTTHYPLSTASAASFLFRRPPTDLSLLPPSLHPILSDLHPLILTRQPCRPGGLCAHFTQGGGRSEPAAAAAHRVRLGASTRGGPAGLRLEESAPMSGVHIPTRARKADLVLVFAYF